MSKTLKWGITILLLVAFSVGCYFAFKALGMLDKVRMQEMLDNKGFFVAAVLYISLFIVQAVFLSLIPGNGTLFIGVGWYIFGNFWMAFTIIVIANFISSLMLYGIGRWGGRRLLYWLFERDSIERKLDWLSKNGVRVVPFLFLIPIMPNDLVCVACGASRMKFWKFLVIIAIFRALEILLLMVYFTYIPKIFKAAVS
ncbi:MAG: VTT domain-containing protein [Firmicutes bacterium]|nr:VTT domain-containing protein [Bacillota bacterium]